MVDTYNQNSNPNMRRPVVKEEIVDFMRQRLQPVTGGLKELEDFAKAENVPVIPHETVAYFRLLLESLQPEKILEIGTAIGFSALLMAEHAPQAQITTIDRNPEMIELAKANFAKSSASILAVWSSLMMSSKEETLLSLLKKLNAANGLFTEVYIVFLMQLWTVLI